MTTLIPITQHFPTGNGKPCDVGFGRNVEGSNMAEACGIVGGALTLAVLFKLFFRDLSALGNAIRFLFTPDVISMFRGEWGEDIFAEMKLGLWLAIGGFVGFGVYAVVADMLAAS